MKVLDLEDAYFHSCKAQRRIPGLFTDQLKIKSSPGYSSLTTLTRDHDHTVPAFFGVIVFVTATLTLDNEHELGHFSIN